ncbi:hypothetical protein LZ32DRAFT_651379 [Colletotrichum eremochloae]|nr:hypothetical protein LZ32DRAFT_651379 [Colletotrichum eremochloae]
MSGSETNKDQTQSNLATGNDQVNEMKLMTVDNVGKSSQQQQQQTLPGNIQRPVNYVVRPEALGDSPDFVDCPWCHSRQKTTVSSEASSTTMIASLFCCIVLACIGAIIPFVCGWGYDVEHRCGQCHKPVARMPDGGTMTAVYPSPTHTQPGPNQNITHSIYAPAEQGP